MEGGVPRYAPCKLCRGSCTRRTLHDSVFSEESWVHRSCRRHARAWDRSKHHHFHDRAWSAAAAPRLSKTRSADVSDGRISSHWGHSKCALCSGVHGVPPDEPVIRGGWRLFDRRHGVHNRRGQPHCRGSTSAGALDLRRCPFAQGARYSAGAGTLLQRRRNRPLDRDATATDRDSLARIVRTAFGRRPLVGQKVEIEGRLHEIVGIMPPGADVMDNHTQVWLPLWLHPNTARQRWAHVLYVIARLKDGVTAEVAQTELSAFLENWGERVGTKDHVPTNRPLRSVDHTLQLRALQDAIVWECQPPDLGSAGRRGIRAAHRLCESCKLGYGSRRVTQ